MKKLFNDNWLFAKGCAAADPFNPSHSFAPVDIPHDWLISDAENLYESSYGIYRKKFTTAAKTVRIYFEGVYQDCTVYVNGREAGENKYGYSSFEVDASGFLCEGENEIAVMVRHESPNSRWYSGAGIFRDVWIIETGEDYIVSDSAYFSAKRSGGRWLCSISAENVGEGELYCELYHEGQLLGGCVGSGTIILPFDEKLVWDIDNPVLLTLKITLEKNGVAVDSVTQRVGLREIEFTPDKGFFLNGRHVKLHGVCLHHDQGALGAAFNKEMERRRLLSMKEMGVNSVRTSHNMPAVGFMELCDELGILVDSEAFDMWERPKTEYDYARYFDEWYQRDVASWVRRDRNHPSLILWSIGNEIYDTHVSDRGREVSKLLHNAVRKHDPRCNAFTTIGSNYIPWEGAQRCAEEVDVVGYNYAEGCYIEHHEKHPDWRIYGSETTAGVKSRGVYHFPLGTAFLTHDDLQCSSLGNCRAGASAVTAEQTIVTDLRHEICAGMYIWTGSDYIGEPTPYSTKNSYYGSVDTAGLKKDSFALYKAAWTNEPVLHLFPYWDFNEGQLIDVVAYTNQPSVELFVNGKSCGAKSPEHYTVSWQVPYERGEIKAVAGELTEVRKSFGDSRRIVLRAGKSELYADGRDMMAVEISTVDEHGNPVENARDRVSVSVEGARLVGFDNGDSTDYESYKSSERKLFGGKAVVLIAASDKSGSAVVTACAPGLKSAAITVTVLPAEVPEGAAFGESIPAAAHSGVIPVRKIALTRSGGRVITPETNGITLTAALLPKNASFCDVEWSVVTNSGIASSVARLEANGLNATLTALGDGEFRVRCSAKNGKPQCEVLSEYEFSAEGFGQAFINPYEFVCSCFYTAAPAQMDEVSEGGIAITNEHNVLGFEKVDFGKYGSDCFRLRCIYWHTNAPFEFKVYAGRPENGRLLGEFSHQADFIWQTYQDREFRLSERLCGEQDIYFEFGHLEQRLYFGGFEFSPVLKAYEEIPAADCDLIHGDTYELSGGSILHIGNNVFIEYADMDFSFGISALKICGKTHHDNDSIHLAIAGEDGAEIKQIVEFPGTADSVTVDIPDFRGRAVVKLGFLPGCDFDMRSLRFFERN